MGSTVDGFAARLRNLFKTDEVHLDNLLFKLHHQVNFSILLIGVLFIFGENYLNGKAIICAGGDDWANQFCWLHGTGHISQELADAVANNMDEAGFCDMKDKHKNRHTSYYVWLPFLLAICMGLVKLPRVIWKTILERGFIKNLVGDDREDGGEIARRFSKIKQKKQFGRYLVLFAFCEFLNLLMLLTCFLIMDKLLNGDYWSYGSDVTHYYTYHKGIARNANPMCGLFPTVVACNVVKGSIGGGGGDKGSQICMLSNNLFNQYYFLILWFWWTLLLSLSIIGLVYRLAQIFIAPFSKMILQNLYLAPFDLEKEVMRLPLTSTECFLLGRLAVNLKGSTLTKVIKALGENQNEDQRLLSVQTLPMVSSDDQTK